MDVICVSVLGENFPSGTTFCPQNFSFLPTSHGLKATFKLRSPAKARKFQISLPASTARKSKTSFSAFAAWLYPWDSSSLLLRRKFYVEFLRQHGARWPLLRAYEFSPHPCSDPRWVSRGPPFAKVGQNFPVSCCPSGVPHFG